MSSGRTGLANALGAKQAQPDTRRSFVHRRHWRPSGRPLRKARIGWMVAPQIGLRSGVERLVVGHGQKATNMKDCQSRTLLVR